MIVDHGEVNPWNSRDAKCVLARRYPRLVKKLWYLVVLSPMRWPPSGGHSGPSTDMLAAAHNTWWEHDCYMRHKSSHVGIQPRVLLRVNKDSTCKSFFHSRNYDVIYIFYLSGEIHDDCGYEFSLVDSFDLKWNVSLTNGTHRLYIEITRVFWTTCLCTYIPF
jgi:hypothetical protein